LFSLQLLNDKLEENISLSDNLFLYSHNKNIIIEQQSADKHCTIIYEENSPDLITKIRTLTQIFTFLFNLYKYNGNEDLKRLKLKKYQC